MTARHSPVASSLGARKEGLHAALAPSLSGQSPGDGARRGQLVRRRDAERRAASGERRAGSFSFGPSARALQSTSTNSSANLVSRRLCNVHLLPGSFFFLFSFFIFFIVHFFFFPQPKRWTKLGGIY